ncbi:hypothetical protein ACJ41O_001519 [Fusarium nematophilum]
MRDSEGLQVDDYGSFKPNPPEVIYQYHQKDNHFPPPAYPPQRIPFGLGVWTFGLLVAAITAIVIGSGVGGGLGAALASCQSSSSELSPAPVETASSPSTAVETATCPSPDQSDNSTTSNNGTDYSPIPAEKVKSLAWDCTEPKQTMTKDMPKGFSFKVYCGLDAGFGAAAEGGGIIKDLAPLIAYSLEDCLYACTEMVVKNETQETGTVCESVSFRPWLSWSLKTFGANCWLKNGKRKQGSDWAFEDVPSVAYAVRE